MWASLPCSESILAFGARLSSPFAIRAPQELEIHPTLVKVPSTDLGCMGVTLATVLPLAEDLVSRVWGRGILPSGMIFVEEVVLFSLYVALPSCQGQAGEEV